MCLLANWVLPAMLSVPGHAHRGGPSSLLEMGEPGFSSGPGALASMDSLRHRETLDGVDIRRESVVISGISGAATRPWPTANRLAPPRRRIGSGTAFTREYARTGRRSRRCRDPGITAGFGDDHLFRIHATRLLADPVDGDRRADRVISLPDLLGRGLGPSFLPSCPPRPGGTSCGTTDARLCSRYYLPATALERTQSPGCAICAEANIGELTEWPERAIRVGGIDAFNEEYDSVRRRHCCHA